MIYPGITQEQLEKAREIGQHVRVTITKSASQRRLEVEFEPLTEQGHAVALSLMDQLVQAMAQQLASFFNIQGKVKNVG